MKSDYDNAIYDNAIYGFELNPQADSILFAAVLLLLQPIQIEDIDPVLRLGV